MDSKQILLKIPNIKEEKFENKIEIKNGSKETNDNKAFKKYVGYENFNQILSSDRNNFIQNNNAKVEFILKKINDKKYFASLYNKLDAVYKDLFLPFITEKTKYLETNILNIRGNLTNFFELQKKYNKITNILSIINFQSLFLEYFDEYFGSLVSSKNLYIHQEIYSISSSIYIENKKIYKFVEDYIEKYDVEFIRKHRQKEISLDEKDNDIIELLQNIFNNIIKKLQKKDTASKKKAYNILTYGSYTSFKINPEVTYNDIDIYSTNPLSLLVPFMVIVKIIFEIDIDIFKIPFVIGHVSLRYKGSHFTDCLYMDDITISKIPTVFVKEIIIVHPILQVINFFRLISEPRRMFALSETKEKKINAIKKLTTMLQYTCEVYDIDISKDLTEIEFDVSTFDDCFLIDLKTLLKHVKGYDNIKDQIEFDYLIISRYSPSLFLEFIKNKHPIIRKQWFALFNEIVVEFHNKKPIINSQTSIKKNKKKLNKVVIKEEDLIFDKLSKLEENVNITNFIKKNNVILTSNFTTEFFMKVVKDRESLLKKYEITSITKETCLASFVITQILTHFSNPDLVKFYFLLLLSFIKSNNKNVEKEMELDILAEKNINDDVYISSLGKNKLEGKHETFTLIPPYLKKIFFYKKQTESVYTNFQEFLDITIYN